MTAPTSTDAPVDKRRQPRTSAQRLAPLFSSDCDTWRTPQVVVDLVREVGGGRITLDPCGGPGSLVGAEVEILPPDDGLAAGWARGGLTYCNPPFGRSIGEWVEKARREHERFKAEVLLLLPARTDTTWWQFDVTACSALCFWSGRMKFVGAKAGAPFPSALVYYGPHRDRFADVFDRHGWVLVIR